MALYPGKSTSGSSIVVEAAIAVFAFLLVVGPILAYFSPDVEENAENEG
jgi:hypothetical protein